MAAHKNAVVIANIRLKNQPLAVPAPVDRQIIFDTETTRLGAWDRISVMFPVPWLLFEADSGRDLPKRGTLGGDNFPMSNLGSGWVKGDPLIPFLFRLRFSSALRDGIGVFKPISC